MAETITDISLDPSLGCDFSHCGVACENDCIGEYFINIKLYNRSLYPVFIPIDHRFLENIAKITFTYREQYSVYGKNILDLSNYLSSECSKQYALFHLLNENGILKDFLGMFDEINIYYNDIDAPDIDASHVRIILSYLGGEHTIPVKCIYKKTLSFYAKLVESTDNQYQIISGKILEKTLELDRAMYQAYQRRRHAVIAGWLE